MFMKTTPQAVVVVAVNGENHEDDDPLLPEVSMFCTSLQLFETLIF